jgi:hypothetical protein
MDIHVYLNIQQSVKQNISDFDLALETALNSFPQERPETVRSIVSQEYQKFVKSNFKSSHSADTRRKLFKNFVSGIQDGAEPGIIINLALREKTSPALAAKIILEEYLKRESSEETEPGDRRVETALRLRVNQLLKNHALVPDRDLSYELLLAKLKDHSYGPIAEAIKHSIGEEHEQKLKDSLNALNIPFSDEHVLRSRGYDKTPDVKLEVPISVNGKIINWIESKALFGDRESHEVYLRDQFWSYWNRFGSGLVIYWFGYIKQLDSNTEAGIVLTDRFPSQSEITLYEPEKITQVSEKLGFFAKSEKGRRSVSDLVPTNQRDSFSTSFGELSLKE